MANQMIALQARAPQSSGLGGAVQQNAQLINMMMQQKAAERQTAQANQAMQIAQNKEARDVTAAEIDLAGKQIDYHYKRATAVNTPQGYQAWLAGVAKDSPEFAEFFVTNLPPEAFDRSALIRMVGSVKDNFDATYAPAATENIIGESGQVGVLSRGGFGPPTIKVPRTLVPAPTRTGEVEVGAPTFADGGMGGPVDMAEAERFIQSFPTEAQAAIRQRINEGALGNIPTGSPVAPQSLVAGDRGGVGGPYEGYVEAPTPFRLKDPMQSPMPSIPPTEDIRRKAVAERETPAEAAARARATKTAELEVEQTKKLPGKRQVSLILGKMRNAYEQLEKAEAIPSEKRGGFSNAFDYLASSSLGREAQKFVGTEESKYLSQIVNLRKALATAIKNATGMSAQEMNSNTELMLTLDTLSDPTQGIEAARMALADLEELYGAPKPAAPAGPRRTPVTGGRPPAGVSAQDWKFMTPQERALWQK